MAGDEEGGTVLQLGRPKAPPEPAPITADTTCIAWLKTKMEMVRRGRGRAGLCSGEAASLTCYKQALLCSPGPCIAAAAAAPCTAAQWAVWGQQGARHGAHTHAHAPPSLPLQLFPSEGSDLRRDIDDPSEWLDALWEPEAHNAAASQFLMNVKAGPACRACRAPCRSVPGPRSAPQPAWHCTRMHTHAHASTPPAHAPQAMRMFALLETKPQLRLVLTLEVPKSFEQLVYFVRDPSKFVTKENISEVRAPGAAGAREGRHAAPAAAAAQWAPGAAAVAGTAAGGGNAARA